MVFKKPLKFVVNGPSPMSVLAASDSGKTSLSFSLSDKILLSDFDSTKIYQSRMHLESVLEISNSYSNSFQTNTTKITLTWATELKKQVLPRFCSPGINTFALGAVVMTVVETATLLLDPLTFFKLAAGAAKGCEQIDECFIFLHH